MNYFNWNLIEYLFSLIESVLFFYFLSVVLKRKENINAFVYMFSIGVYFIIISFLTNVLHFSNNTFIIIVLISLIYAICLYKGNLKNKIIFPVIFFMVLVLCDVLTANIFGIIMKVNIQEVIFTEEWFRGFLFCISKMTLILILKTISYFIGNDKINIPSRYWYMIMITFVVSLVILMIIGEIGISTPYHYNKPTYFVISCIGILIINIFVQYIFIQLSRYYEREQIYNTIKVGNEIMEKSYIEREQVYKETRKLRHDFKNHIICILTLIESNKIDEAKKYVEQISETITIYPAVINSGNDVVDAVLSQKLVEAQKLNIYMHIEATVPREAEVKPMDLCSILSNVIDNAIEAAMKINKKNERKIKIKINQYKDYLFIAVLNTVESNPLEGIKKIRTTKRDSRNHGLGIQIVQNAVEKYNGSIEYIYTNNTVEVKILIKLKE